MQNSLTTITGVVMADHEAMHLPRRFDQHEFTSCSFHVNRG